MFTQQSVYILGIVNLLLAALAIFCVVQAQDHREYFFLVYIAVCIFIFYMVTIFVIIVLQIMETYRERRQYNPSALPIPTRINAVIDENVHQSNAPKIYLSRSQTLPLILSPPSQHSSTSKNIDHLSTGLLSAATTHLALLTNHPSKWSTVHRNYRSFTFVTNDHS